MVVALPAHEYVRSVIILANVLVALDISPHGISDERARPPRACNCRRDEARVDGKLIMHAMIGRALHFSSRDLRARFDRERPFMLERRRGRRGKLKGAPMSIFPSAGPRGGWVGLLTRGGAQYSAN